MQIDVLMESAPSARRTLDRVRSATPRKLNYRIDQAMIKRIWHFARQPRSAIDARLEALDREWDIERVVESNAAGLALLGVIMSAFSSRRWLLLPASVLACLLQHSLTRKSVPVQLLRYCGVRTRREIEAEKNALRMLRGDFDSLKNVSEDTHRAIEAVRLSRG